MDTTDLDVTMVDLRVAASEDDVQLTVRDWLNLGVLCVLAAETANADGNRSATHYYTKLASKCDRMADELPPRRAARGTIAPKVKP
jgi:hypothetical protein